MKKVIMTMLIILGGCLLLKDVRAANVVNIYFFHGDGCPHCFTEDAWLEELKKQYDNIDVHEYEVWYNEENNKRMEQLKEMYQVTSKGVPFTIIGNQVFLGFSEQIGINMEEKIKECSLNGCQDDAGIILGITTDTTTGDELEPEDDTNTKEEELQNQKQEEDSDENRMLPYLIALGTIFLISGSIIMVYLYRKKKLERV